MEKKIYPHVILWVRRAIFNFCLGSINMFCIGLSIVSSPSPTSETRTMHKVQQELYDMLGIIAPQPRRRRSLSGPESERNSEAFPALSQRPLSADISTLGASMQSGDEVSPLIQRVLGEPYMYALTAGWDSCHS
jgi:hypothetical protein